VESIAAQKPGAARNVLLAARAMFTYAVHREMIEYNPFSGVGVAVPQAAPKTRERVLTAQEIKHAWQTLSNWGGSETIRRAILFVLVTGQRPGEVAGMRRREIDKSGRWWTIPAERSKNGRENRVYLPFLARQLLPAGDEYIFPAGRGAEGPVYINTLSHHLSHHNKPPYLGIPRWTPHDLRRTAATNLSELGCSDEVIDAILNHKKQGVISIYNRNKYDREKREWLIRWSKQLRKIIKEKSE
jgi:integrase